MARIQFWGFVCAALVAPIGLLACGSGDETPPPAGAGSPAGGAGGGGSVGGDGGSGSTDPTGEKIPASYKSGSRLRARVRDGGGGAVDFRGWRDTKIDESCAFMTAEDGKMRCLPDMDQPATLRYLDANCTQPVGVRSCGSKANYILQSSPDACDPATAPRVVYQLGAAVASAPTYMNAAGTCLPAGPGAADTELHEITKLSPVRFASATLAEEARGPRMAVQILNGEDGSFEMRSIRDTELNILCTAQPTGQDELRCAPALSALAGGSFFGDDGCTAPLLSDMTSADSCPAPSFARDDGGAQGCNPVWKATTVGKKVASDSVYQGGPSMCTLASFVPPSWSFYEKGDAVDVSTLARLASHDIGKGRLHMAYYMTDSHVALLPSGRFYDSEREQTCIVQAFTDGKQRCVPEDVESADLYSDAACTAPLAAVAADPSCPKPPPKQTVTSAAPSDPMCVGVRVIERVYSVGGKFTGPKVWARTGTNSCTELDPASLGMDIYSIDKELGATAFAEVTETIE